MIRAFAGPLLVMLLGLLFGAMVCERRIMRRHGEERPDLPCTGGDVARQMLDAAGLKHVLVQVADAGDGYDPVARTVLLRPGHLQGQSITAVAVAAHEVAHAMQHRDGSRCFHLRRQVQRLIVVLRLAALAFLVLFGTVGAMQGSPAFVLQAIAIAVFVFALSVLAHLASLPLEFDASFSRALPALRAGGYLPERDFEAARSVLKATVLTYVAGATLSVLQLARGVR